MDWIDDTDSRVDVAATALADLRGIARLGGGPMRGTIKVPALREASIRARTPGGRRELGWQIAGFSVIGVTSTLANIVLYLLLRNVMPALAANALSLLVTAVANTAANRRLTFGISGRSHAARHQLKGLLTVRGRPRAHLGRAGRAARGHGVAGPGCGGGGTGHRQPGRDRAPVPALPHLGIRWPPPAARQGGGRAASRHRPSHPAPPTDGSIH